MLEAARRHRVPPDRLSFAGTLAACRCCGQALLQTRSDSRRRQWLAQRFLTIASDLVPHRPGRREPRAVKRRPKPYPRLTCHRHRFRVIQHQNRYDIPVTLRPAHPQYLGLNSAPFRCDPIVPTRVSSPAQPLHPRDPMAFMEP